MMTNAAEMGWDEVKNCDAGEQGLILVPASLSNIKHTIRYRIHLKKTPFARFSTCCLNRIAFVQLSKILFQGRYTRPVRTGRTYGSLYTGLKSHCMRLVTAITDITIASREYYNSENCSRKKNTRIGLLNVYAKSDSQLMFINTFLIFCETRSFLSHLLRFPHTHLFSYGFVVPRYTFFKEILP